MKVLAIFCLFGLAAASRPSLGSELGWEPGHEYVFHYRGRQLTGIPELASHYSGVGMRAKVRVTVESPSRFGLKVTEPFYVRVNDVLQPGSTVAYAGSAAEGQASHNWRNVTLPQLTPVPQESATYLAMDTVFEMDESTGEFRSLIVSKEEPEWSVNYKKALVTIFQTKTADAAAAVRSNEIENEERAENFWRVKEQSVDGLCEVMYQLNELPSYILKDRPDLAPVESICQGQKFFELTKTKDVASCSQRASFNFYKPGNLRCPVGNCDGMRSRSSITRYIACGQPGSLQIQTIINEGEMVQQLFGFKFEKFLSGTQQILMLEAKKPFSSGQPVPTPSDPITLNTLFYVYQMPVNSPSDEMSELGERASRRWSKISPRNLLMTGSLGKKPEELPNPSKLAPQVKKLISELIQEDLFAKEDIAKKQITLKVLNIAKGFSMLDKATIDQVYNELKGQFNSPTELATFRNIFFDTLIMGGSLDNIIVFKEKALEGEITSTQMATLFMGLPNYVVMPNRTIMEEVFKLVTSSKVKENSMLFNHAILSMSTLVNKACILPNRQTSYPTYVYGEFCNPDSEIVVDKWIPYLKSQLEQSSSNPDKKNVVVVALGLMAHSQIVPILLPVVENSLHGQESPMTRFLALYSLSKPGALDPQLVVPVAFAVFSNQAENIEMRIAAFNMLLTLNPSMTMFHKIAAATWKERNTEVLKVVNTALFSLANQQLEMPMITTSLSKYKKAAMVYPLIKQTAGRLPTSGTIYNSDYLPKLEAGFESETTWTASKDSMMPAEFYHKITYLINQYEFSLYEIGMRFHDVETVVEELVQMITTDRRDEEVEEHNYSGAIPAKIAKNLSHGLKSVMEKLRVETRSNEAGEGLFWANIMENGPIFRTFQTQSARAIKSQLSELFREKPRLALDINFQRALDLIPVEVVIPSDMGLPIVMEVHMPVTFSLRGNTKLELSGTKPSASFSLKTMYASQLIGWVGTICPFSRDAVMTGVDHHSVFNVPADMNIELDMPEQKLSVVFKPMPSVSSPVDIVHFHVRPFTVYQKYLDLSPMTLSSKMKYIESPLPSREVSLTFGKYLGLNLRSVITTQSAFLDMSGVARRASLFNYNPLNFLRFGWAPSALASDQTPSCRQHMYLLKYDPNSSQTKEITFKMRLGVATKSPEEESPRYHTVKTSTMKLESRKLDEHEHGEHEERCRKIKSVLEKLGPVEAATGVSLIISTELKGSQTRSFTYSVNVATGYAGLKQKWHVLMVSATDPSKKICVDGAVSMPMVPVWKVDEIRASDIAYNYNNVIGFGKNCQESQIKVTGTSRVSEEQKKFSRESHEAKEYRRLMSKNEQLAEVSGAADKVRAQASGIDQVDYSIEYKNVPEIVFAVNSRAVDYLKAYLWPYYSISESHLNPRPSRPQSPMAKKSAVETVQVRIHQRNQTFDLSIKRPEAADSMVAFRGIRIPYPVNYILPASAVRNPLDRAYEVITGKTFSPLCKMDGAWLRTYNNATASIKSLDGCYHLLTGDCSQQKRFAVMVRLTKPEAGAAESPKEIEALIGRTNITVLPSSYHSKYSTDLEVYIDGHRIRIPHGKDVMDSEGHKVAHLEMSRDGVFSLSSPWLSLTFNGYKADLKPSPLLKNKLCGLCGNANGQKTSDLSGPSKCVYSKPEILMASYRLPPPTESGRCAPLPEKIRSELEKENRECAKYRIIPTKVMDSFKVQSGRCIRHKHEIVEKSHELCFSRLPITVCGRSCKPESREGMVTKKVSFTCLPKARLAEHYAEMVRSGRVLPELKNSPEAFEVAIRQPRACVPISIHRE